ncbi:MAG: TadE/TadG family type IV pilus assembly protein [Sphingomonadaceae bacterium]
MMATFKLRARAIKNDKQGTAAIEFGFVAPVFCLLLMGILDVGYTAYVKSILQGTVESTGRESSLEASLTSSIDAKVTAAMRDIVDGQISFSRVYYQNYQDIRLPEDFTDVNRNGIREPGECYIDRNANEVWDADVGLGGRGGAQDVVIYKAALTFDRPFPLWQFLGQSNRQTVTGITQIRNQPFSAQTARVGVQICT